MRAPDGGVVVEADSTEIVDRILEVLAQGATSLSRMDDVEAASTGAAPRPRRFDFVHDAALRPVLEQAFDDSRHALERGESGLALILSCGVIEAIITDALQHCGSRIADDGSIADLSFEARIARGGTRGPHSRRLRAPAAGRRERTGISPTPMENCGRTSPVSEREARVTTQVLHVVMRDLDPGR